MADVKLSICVTGAADSPHESERAGALARLGHRVSMLSPTPARLHDIPVIATAGYGLRMRLLRRPVMMTATLWHLARQKVDVVHCHYAAEYATWAAALLGKRPLIITVMGGDVLFDEQGRQGFLGRALTRFALRRADLVTVKSPRLATVVEAMGVPTSKIMQVLWGIDLANFIASADEVARLRAEWGATPNAPVLLSPRPLKPFYNQQLMIAALPAICARHPDVRLVMSSYGEEPGYRDALIAQAEALGVADALHFAAPRAHAAMAGLYAASDIVLSLPSSDGFPQTLIEAAATGRPCIMVGPDRFRGLIEPGREALFTELTAADLAEKIVRLADDRNFGAGLAQAALAFAREHADLMKDAARVSDRMIALKAAL